MTRLGSVLASLVPEHLASVELIRREVEDVYRTLGPVVGTGFPSSSNYYHYYPYLFSEAFPGIGDSALRTLAIAGVLYLDHVCFLDDLVDDGTKGGIHRPFMSSLLHERSLVLLQPLFPPESLFWNLLSGFHREFATAMLCELRKHRGVCSPYSREEWMAIAKGKSALSKGTSAAMSLLSGRGDHLSAISESQDCFNIAMQLYDDVRDWRDDLSRGVYTLMLSSRL